MKFTKPFYGVRAGEIYPVHFAPGDECPPELEAAALSLGALADPDPEAPAAPEIPEEPAPADKPAKGKK